jgi:uncharacterized membrane protein YeiH
MTLIAILNYLGVATAATRASLTVTRRGADIVSVVLLAAVAGIGGGTVRDLLTNAPPFWFRDQGYLAACLIPAALVRFLGVGRNNARLLDVADAIGIGAYAVAGCQKAEEAGLPFIATSAVSAIAATWGGLMREIRAGEPTVLVRKEVYITAALFASLVFIGTEALGLRVIPAVFVGGAAGTGLRLLAIWRAFEIPGPPWLPQEDQTAPLRGSRQ